MKCAVISVDSERQVCLMPEDENEKLVLNTILGMGSRVSEVPDCREIKASVFRGEVFMNRVGYYRVKEMEGEGLILVFHPQEKKE